MESLYCTFQYLTEKNNGVPHVILAEPILDPAVKITVDFVEYMKNQAEKENAKPSIIPDPSSVKETAIVTRKPLSESTAKLKPNAIKDLQNKLGGIKKRGDK